MQVQGMRTHLALVNVPRAGIKISKRGEAGHGTEYCIIRHLLMCGHLQVSSHDSHVTL